MRPQIALSLMGGEAAREYTCAMGDGGVDSTPPHPLLLSLFIIILFLQYFRRHSLLCLSLVLSCCCVPSSFFVVFIKLSPKLHPQSHFFNVLAVSSACIFFFLSFFLSPLFIFHLPRRPSLCESRKEWCWSSCSLCHLHILTSLTDDSQVIDQKISRSEVQRSMPPDRPRSEANQNSAKVQYSFTFYFSHLSLFLLGFLPFSFKFPPLQRLFFFSWCHCLCNELFVCCLPT